MAGPGRKLLEGILGRVTATFYRLDPTGRVPLSPIGEVIDKTGNLNKLSTDMIESESGGLRGTLTRHTMEDRSQVTTGFYLEPEARTIVGLISSSVPIPLVGGVGGGAILATLQARYGLGTRPDLIMLANLRAMMARGEPIAVATPRWSNASVVITAIDDSWAPGQGEMVRATISVEEARIVRPEDAKGLVPDIASLTGGNYIQSNAGAQPLTQSTAPVSGGGVLAAPTVG